MIGSPTRYNLKKRKKLTIQELIKKPTPYPTLVIPVGKNGFCSHCICVVDDLIFDAITPYALCLHMDSFEWIFGIQVKNLHVVQRFQNKVSKKG